MGGGPKMELWMKWAMLPVADWRKALTLKWYRPWSGSHADWNLLITGLRDASERCKEVADYIAEAKSAEFKYKASILALTPKRKRD